MNLNRKIRNGIYAQAVADAVGNKFEFKVGFNRKEVTDYANSTDKLVISDDTQMMLWGFDALHKIPFMDNYTVVDATKEAFTKSYVKWYHTQTEEYNPEARGFLSFKSLFSRQAPGWTCLDSLEDIIEERTVWNDSCGCGSVMRLLPTLMFLEDLTPSKTITLARLTGAITHLHINSDIAIAKYVTAAYNIINDYYIPKPKETNISDIGEGWTAIECVDMAVWAYCNATTFDELLELSITHDGDSDSVAAVAGSLWGIAGKDVPLKYIEKLDALDAIEYIADRI